MANVELERFFNALDKHMEADKASFSNIIDRLSDFQTKSEVWHAKAQEKLDNISGQVNKLEEWKEVAQFNIQAYTEAEEARKEAKLDTKSKLWEFGSKIGWGLLAGIFWFVLFTLSQFGILNLDKTVELSNVDYEKLQTVIKQYDTSQK